MALILLQPDTGSALVFFGFMLVFYREGLPGYFIFLGLGAIVVSVLALAFSSTTVLVLIALGSLVALGLHRLQRRLKFRTVLRHPAIWYGLLAMGWALTVNQVFNSVLQPHQKLRVQLLLGQVDQPSAAGYQTAQSLIAIGSGGFVGKGYMQGTQTRLNFVPAQTTDYICGLPDRSVGVCGPNWAHSLLGRTAERGLFPDIRIWNRLHFAHPLPSQHRYDAGLGPRHWHPTPFL